MRDILPFVKLVSRVVSFTPMLRSTSLCGVLSIFMFYMCTRFSLVYGIFAILDLNRTCHNFVIEL